MRAVALFVSLAFVLISCSSGREVIDGGTAARFRGDDYLAVGGSRFDVDLATLQPAGSLDGTNLEDTDGTAYALPGVEPTIAFVVKHVDGAFEVFAPKKYFAPGQPPLGVLVPELCPFLIEPETDGCQ